MSNKTTAALIGGIISTLYIMTLFINQSYWLYHWTLRLGGLLGFFLLGTLGKMDDEGVPIWSFIILAGHYFTIFTAELTVGYISFLHLEVTETFKNYLLGILLVCPLFGASVAAIVIGAYCSTRWNIYES